MDIVNKSQEKERSVFSRLWNNKDARSVIIQILTIALVFAALSIILHNITVNLAAIGKDFSFDFLGHTAGYDITFSPFLDYTSSSTHFEAAIVGLLNTLLIAFCGIILATIIGFIFGIMRLSNNWLINKIAYCFVEFTRNVPILLHILFIHGIVIQLPVPRQAVNFIDSFFLTNRGLFIPKPEWGPNSWIVGLCFIISIAIVIILRTWNKKRQEQTGVIYPIFWISISIIVLFTLGSFFLTGMPLTWSVPELRGFNFRGGVSVRPEFVALWLALSYYTASFIAEIVRSGILAISKGQNEAAGALGLTKSRTLQLIIIPQAMRIIIPPLASQYLNLTKNSSLAIAIGYMDLVATIGGISLMQTGKEMETMIIVLLTYLVISLIISAFMNWYNRATALVER